MESTPTSLNDGESFIAALERASEAGDADFISQVRPYRSPYLTPDHIAACDRVQMRFAPASPFG